MNFFFFQQIFRNLHVVLCFTPLSRQLGEACREFPGLLTQATVDIFDEWPAKALYILAIKEMQDDRITQTPCGTLLKVLCDWVYRRVVNSGLPLIQPPLKSIKVSWLEGWPHFRGNIEFVYFGTFWSGLSAHFRGVHIRGSSLYHNSHRAAINLRVTRSFSCLCHFLFLSIFCS